jgi:hypothetical protein
MASNLPFEYSPIWSDVGAAPATSLTGKPQLEIGQTDVIRPPIAADRCVVAAAIIGTIDQETANASSAHFCEGDLLAGEGGHAPLKRGPIVRAIAHFRSSRRFPRCDYWNESLRICRSLLS